MHRAEVLSVDQLYRMSIRGVTDELDEEPRDRGNGPGHLLILYTVALLLALPIFIILYPFVPSITLPIGGGVRVDHVLTFVVVLAAFLVLVKRFQLMVYAVLIVGLCALAITGLAGGYGFGDLFDDYAVLLHSLRKHTIQLPSTSPSEVPFAEADRIRAVVDDHEPVVRNFAVMAATTHFGEVEAGVDETTFVQCLSVFKTINGRWRYVSDVKGGEYFAKASESVGLMAGDCDDHAVLMAACIKSIGGEVRLVRTRGHLYPELKIGDGKQMERAAYLIRRVLFPREVGDAPLYHHTDADGTRWINMDYTRSYPGGDLLEEEILGIIIV